MANNTNSANSSSQVQSGNKELALHTLGWKAFQDLSAQICDEILLSSVAIYREANDGGQDAVFSLKSKDGSTSIGTVQCKFTSDPRKRLKESDIKCEEENIRELVKANNAHSYIFITNMGVDAPVALNIKEDLKLLGVSDPQVYGKDWITLRIQESSRLRALVPRVYGLGDLSTILDERCAEQTKAVLGHLVSTLSVYVPTSSHRGAIRVIDELGIVLLLGAPATGKSTIAAILATMAQDANNHTCFQLDGPNSLSDHWNPNESGRFYWIDDAFGSNQLRDDYVDTWIAIVNKIKTAISNGNRFVLTSRTHIWRAAKEKLQTRNHPDLANGKAVIDVGSLSPDERSQILYNHIKAGNQPAQWKSKIKPHLESLAKLENLLPEIARRLGDSNYTNKIISMPDDLIRFVAKPMEFLKETIGELNEANKAALTLVFLNRSRLSANVTSTEDFKLVGDKYGVSQSKIGDALQQLDGSFLSLKSDVDGKWWTFKHPTIADALSDILRERPDLVDLFIRGVGIEALLSETICIGSKHIENAVVIPESINEHLLKRIIDTPDDLKINSALFKFLSDRTSDDVLKQVVEMAPQLLERDIDSSSYWSMWRNSKVTLFARLNHLRILPKHLVSDVLYELKDAIKYQFDASFLDDELILDLFPSTELLKLSLDIYSETLDKIYVEIDNITEDADLSQEPLDNFDRVNTFIEQIENAYDHDGLGMTKLEKIKSHLQVAIEKVKEKKEEYDNDHDDIEWDWNAGKVVSADIKKTNLHSRSLFSDVDE